MNYNEGDKVTREFVDMPDGYPTSSRWKKESDPNVVIFAGMGDDAPDWVYDDDDEPDDYDFERLFADDYGFTVHAWCRYTNKLAFTHGAYVYAWEVFMENDKDPDTCYYCESFSLDERDFDAENYEIWRIADAHVGKVASIVGADPHWEASGRHFE